MKLRLSSLFFLFWIMCANPMFGQINLGGLAEFELRKGGADSGPAVNQTPNDKWLVYAPSVRFFVDAPISENWSVSGALQSDYYYGYRSSIFVSSLNLSWFPSDQLKITGGRFTTPFGRYDELLLSSQNPFVHLPLTHVWNWPVNHKQGYFYAGTYGEVYGQSMIHRRLYSQGLMIGGTTENEAFQYQLASTLTSVSGYTDTGQQNRPAFIGRLILRPAIWNKIGISLANGPFLIEDPVNEVLTSNKRAGYHQTIATAYTDFSYRYYQLLLQYTFNRWDAPWISPEGNLIEDHIALDAAHYLAQFKIRFPFWVGGYGALRYERLYPKQITLDSRNVTGQPTPDKNRVELVLGYSINRNITLKTSYLLSRNSQRELADDVFAIQISAGF